MGVYRILQTIILILTAVLLAACGRITPRPVVTQTEKVETSLTLLIPTTTPVPSPTQPLNPLPTLVPTASEPTHLAPDPSGLSPSGPWLVYSSIDSSWLHTLFASSRTTDHHIFLSNADGLGATPVAVNVYDPNELPDISSDINRLAILDGLVYLVRLDEAQAYLLSGHPQQFLGLDFGGDAESGYLASVRGELPQTIPELIVHTLPSGEIRDRILLLRCPDDQPDCEAEINYQFAMNGAWSSRLVGGLQQIAWSPDGRFLAYAAVQEGPTSDLYLYNPEDGSTRRMTGGPNYIGKIWWSPNGNWIIFESYSQTEEILWAARVDGGQIRRLYSAPLFGSGQGLSGWLDNDRFLSHDGYFAVDDGYSHLRLVNLDSGEVKTLFPDIFNTVTFDPRTGTIILLLPVSNYENEPPWPGYEGHGWYMLSVDDTTLRRLEKQQFDLGWDRDLEVFVTSERCESDANSLLALTSVGLWRCVPLPVEIYASPDGRWQVTVADGIWLGTPTGELLSQVSTEYSGQVIWRPDSKGFFLVVNRTLEYVSVPDLAVRVVDDQLRNFPILYQWLYGGD